MQTVSPAVAIVVYGFPGIVPVGGFPTVGYTSVIKEVQRLQNDTGIFPPTIVKDTLLVFYYSQRIRWGFKKLLYNWYRYKNRDNISNTEDLIGNDIEKDSPNTILLWDWDSKKNYIFTHDDIVSHFNAKLKYNIHPTNPYTNIKLSYSQLLSIKNHLGSSFSNPYLKYEGNMLINTQYNMVKSGYPEIEHMFDLSNISLAEVILLENILGNPSSVTRDKRILYKHIKDTIFKLLLVEDTNTALIPYTKIEYLLYNMYCKYDIEFVIDWTIEWINKNRKILVLKRSKIL